MTTDRRVVRCFAGPDQSDDALRGTMGRLIDTTRESSDLSAELSRERRAVEDRAGRLLRACGHGSVPTGLVVALTEGAALNLVVQHRPDIADRAVEALVLLAFSSGGRRPQQGLSRAHPRRHPAGRAVQDPGSTTAQSSGRQAPCCQLEHDDQHHGAVVRSARGRGHRSRPGASPSVMRVMVSCSSCGTCHERHHQDVEQRHGDSHGHGHAHRSHRQRPAHQTHHAERTQHSHDGHDQRPPGTVATAHRHPSVNRCRAGDAQYETALQQPDRDGRRWRCTPSWHTRRSRSPRLSGGHRRLPGEPGPLRWPRRRSGPSRLR